MPKTNLTTRRNRQTIEDLEYQLQMTRVALTLLAHQPTPTSILTRSQRLRVADVAKKAGGSAEGVMRRAVDLWLQVEAPVYLAQA